MGNTNAESTKKSLAIPTMGGNSLQRSERAVAPHSTPTVDALSKKQLIVLVTLFQALLNNTMSPDVRELSIGATVGGLRGIMEEEEVEQIARKLMSFRHRNIMDSMF